MGTTFLSGTNKTRLINLVETREGGVEARKCASPCKLASDGAALPLSRTPKGPESTLQIRARQGLDCRLRVAEQVEATASSEREEKDRAGIWLALHWQMRRNLYFPAMILFSSSSRKQLSLGGQPCCRSCCGKVPAVHRPLLWEVFFLPQWNDVSSKIQYHFGSKSSNYVRQRYREAAPETILLLLVYFWKLLQFIVSLYNLYCAMVQISHQASLRMTK